MGHITLERLAQLVGDPPSPEEEEHLKRCSACRDELKGLKEQTEAIGSLPDLRPPAGDWEALEARLAAEGLVRSSGLSRRPSRWWSPGWLQAAAALILFLGGTAVGSGAWGDGGSEDLATTPPPGLELIPVGAQAQPVSNLAEAAAAVNTAEQQYMLALLQYRQILDAQGEPTYIGDPTTRLAAIEAIVAAGRAAIQQAPADPYVNGVLVSALAEREAFLRKASLNPAEGVF